MSFITWLFFLCLQPVIAGPPPTQLINGTLVLMNRHQFFVQTERTVHPIDTTQFSPASLKLLYRLVDLPVTARCDLDRHFFISLERSRHMALLFAFPRMSAHIEVYQNKIALVSAPLFSHHKSSYPFVMLTTAKSMRPVALEGPLIDHSWLRSFAKDHRANLEARHRFTGQFTTKSSFYVDRVEGPDKGVLATGRLMSVGNGLYVLKCYGGRREKFEYVTSELDLSEFNKKEVVLEGQLSQEDETETITVGPTHRIQLASEFICEKALFRVN